MALLVRGEAATAVRSLRCFLEDIAADGGVSMRAFSIDGGFEARNRSLQSLSCTLRADSERWASISPVAAANRSCRSLTFCTRSS